MVAMAVAALVAAAGGAGAATIGDDAADPTQHAATPIAAPDEEQLAAFAVLRRDRSVQDALPEVAARLVAHGPGSDLGANADLSRLTTSEGGRRLYLVPGRGWLCVVDEDGGGGCNRTAQARDGYLVARRQVSAGTLLAGGLPDGVETVTVRGEGGASEQVPVRDNGWTAAVTFAPQTVEFLGAAGDRVVPVGVTPG